MANNETLTGETKMNGTELLNKVQAFMVDFANQKGINLKTEFGTVEAFKKFVIAFTFKTLIDIGLETKAAYDLVFGSGEYEALAERVWAAVQ